jgi:DnaJ family protein C protein 30
VASEKFRAISEAYEVLGTYRLKKMYDKGIIHTAGSEFSHHSKAQEKTQPYDVEDELNDDDTTRFYKSRLRREHTGKSKIYDFDEWTSAHYGKKTKHQMEGILKKIIIF